MDYFDPYNVLLVIATNIPALLMTAFVTEYVDVSSPLTSCVGMFEYQIVTHLLSGLSSSPGFMTNKLVSNFMCRCVPVRQSWRWIV